MVRSGREEAEEGETQTSPTFTQYGAVGSATCAEMLVCCGLIVFGFMWWGMEVGVEVPVGGVEERGLGRDLFAL